MQDGLSEHVNMGVDVGTASLIREMGGDMIVISTRYSSK